MKINNRFISVILLVLLMGCTTVEGQASEVRTFSGVDGVALLGSGDLSITIGNKEEITINAPADLIQYLITEEKDGTLYIGKRKKGWKKFKHLNENIHYDLVVKSISRVSVSGSGDIDTDKLSGEKCSVKVSGSGSIEVEQISSKKLKVNISGSGDIDINNLSADILGVSINGSGDINIDGKADELDVTISGSGDFTGNKLKSDDASINIYGSGDAHVWAAKSLEVHVSGSGNVTYHGDPSINSRTTGSGHIKHR
jgi:hypothetical protein